MIEIANVAAKNNRNTVGMNFGLFKSVKTKKRSFRGRRMTKQTYLDPTQDQGRDLFLSGLTGAVTMLNLLRFRDIADHSLHRNLAPETPITGKEAYSL